MVVYSISENKQVSFKYFEYTIDKEKKFRKNGERYIVSPYSLSWDDENYYLITFSEKYNDFTHYRVDKMIDMEIIEQTRAKLPNNLLFNVAQYSKKVFNMFGGQEETVKLHFDNSLVNVVIDRFGKDISIEKSAEEQFSVRIKVAVSPAFFAWLFQFEDKVKIISPKCVVEEYKTHLKKTLNQY